MMKRYLWYRAFENPIIYVFTVFTWWTEVRFEKDNVYWAAQVHLLGFGLSLAFGFPFWLELMLEGRTVLFFLVTALLLVALLIFFCVAVMPAVFRTILIHKYPQGFPNPNKDEPSKVHERLDSCRIMVVDIVMILYLSFLVLSFGMTSMTPYIKTSFLLLCFAATFWISEMLLACDSIPPGEKRKRQEANHLQHVAPLPSAI